MKKTLAILLCLGVAIPAFAKNNNTTGKGFIFVPSEVNITTIADAKDKDDDTLVVLQGRIVKSLGDDKYTFKDKTGEIIIEIDDDDFDGVSVTAGEMIEITGNVDKNIMKPNEIDVKSIKKLGYK